MQIAYSMATYHVHGNEAIEDMEDAYKDLSKETRKAIGLDLDAFVQRAKNCMLANQAVLLETIDPNGGIYPGPGLPDARHGPKLITELN